MAGADDPRRTAACPAGLGMHLGVARRRRRDGEGQRPVHVGVVLHLRPGEQVLLHPAGQFERRRIEAARRHRTEIHHIRAPFPGAVDQCEADCRRGPEVPWLQGRERESRRHGRVDRVAAGIEHGDPGLRRRADLGDDHAAFAGGRRLGQQPILRVMRRGGVVHGRLLCRWCGRGHVVEHRSHRRQSEPAYPWRHPKAHPA